MAQNMFETPINPNRKSSFFDSFIKQNPQFT